MRVTATRSGVRVRLPERGPFGEAREALDGALRDGSGVRGLAVTVEAAGRSLAVAELRELETLLLEKHGAALLQVVEGGPQVREGQAGSASADGAGSATEAAPPRKVRAPRLEAPASDEAQAKPRRGRPTTARPALPQKAMGLVGTPDLPVSSTATLLVKRTLRSGQRVRFAGNVVVLGDVNPGAEIVASGDIVVMGTLRGVAHAGATGGEGAIVAAFRLQPTQLRVGSFIGRSPDGGNARTQMPELARVRDGALVIERYVP